jgi:hypothetical protein
LLFFQLETQGGITAHYVVSEGREEREKWGLTDSSLFVLEQSLCEEDCGGWEREGREGLAGSSSL